MNKKKVVYFVGHYGGFLLCLFHKSYYYKEEDALFIYVKTYSSEPTNAFMDKVAQEYIEKFGNVICMDESMFWGLASEEETENKIIQYYDNILNMYDIQLSADTDIYMNFDEFNSMGIYLANKYPKGITGIITTAVERLVSYVNMYIFNDIDDRIFYSKLQRKYRTLDKDAIYVTKIFRTFDIDKLDAKKIKKEAYNNAKEYEYFDLELAKKSICLEHKNSINKLFVDEVVPKENEICNMLMLSSNFTSFKLSTSDNEFIYGNQIIADYFLNNLPLAIKPHPRADYGRVVWEEAFINGFYIASFLPAEYMENLNISVNTILATGSTGTSSVSENAGKIINLGRDYWFYFQFMHKAFITIGLASFIESKNLYVFGLPIEMMISVIQNYPICNSFEKIERVVRINDVEEDAVIIIPVSNNLGIEVNNWMKADLKEVLENKPNIIVIFLDIDRNSIDGPWNVSCIKNQLIEFVIEKKAIRDNIYADIEDEFFSVYCSNAEKRAQIKQFANSYILRNAGLQICARYNAERVMVDNEEDFLFDKICGLENSLNRMSKSLNSYMKFWDERVSCIENIEQYLCELVKLDKCIIISVRDTPGHKITPDLAKKIQSLGIKENLHAKHWNSYVAIINNNNLIYEKIDEMNGIYYENLIYENNISVRSAALKHGNVSEIKINGKNFSVNGRGLNIVVYDLINKKLIDSVCFDTHMKNIPCKRNEMIIFS